MERPKFPLLATPNPSTRNTYRPTASSSESMSQRQKDYIKDLLAKRAGHPAAEDIRTKLNECLANNVIITRRLASEMIDAIKALPPAPPPLPAHTAQAVQQIASYEDGEVTMAALGGEQPKWLGKFALGEEPDLMFYQVDRPTKGKWAGWVFVKRLIGSPGDWQKNRLSKPEQARILELIAEDPMGAQRKYGLHFVECGRCASPLSHPCSRAAGYGEICAGHTGWPYPTMAEAEAILIARYGEDEAYKIMKEYADAHAS